ncbi:alpha/beta-hydrolase [Lichtheimia hyalospora FSU 10163]|nr:alpha/beta-hydrolase [Lichtheimia hyalospora FSU 10163]
MSSSYSEHCCRKPPIESDYKPKGTMVNFRQDLPVYVIGPENATKAIVVYYDIHGFHDNTKQLCDLLSSESGCKVVMPDFLFRGQKPLNLLALPRDEMIAWVMEHGTIDVISEPAAQIRDWLKEQGVTKCGIVGLCWGGKVGVQLTGRDSFYNGAVLLHQALMDLQDAEEAGAPILALPSKDEPDMTEYMDILSKKPFGDKCGHKRFDDMPHGFAGAGADFNNELNIKRVQEAIQLIVDFMKQVL